MASPHERRITGWALGGLARTGKNKLEAIATLDELQKRFGLDALGREVLALAWAAERSLEVARGARSWRARRALTVEVARDALGQPLDAVLAPGAPLRRHALVTARHRRSGAGDQRAAPRRPAWAPRLEGKPLELDGFAPGVRACSAMPVERFPASAKVAELVKDRIVSRRAAPGHRRRLCAA